jgi:DNA mismatch endonuclease (patch repair protein)
MGDIFQPKKRSQIMASVRSHGNKRTELKLIELFQSHGIRGWRRRARVFGRPDFIFRGPRIAVFVDGCFWHSCPKHRTTPASNRLFWVQKLERNRRRDRLVDRTLRRSGWRVVRIWQHELNRTGQAKLLRRLGQSFANLNAT